MMENALMKIEETAMTVSELVDQVQKIQQYMNKVMQKDEHYGIIPGTKKPTLLKPGAEKLCLAFRLDPNYELVREIREKGFIAYTVKCSLSHIPTGNSVASGIGSCNSREMKYHYRSANTGKPVPGNYWKDRDPALLGGSQFSPRKKDGKWFIFEQIENDNPWDLDNTLIKMACKRALVAATLNATAASDIFTQDIEDMDKDIPQTEEVDSDIIEGEIIEGEVEEMPTEEKKEEKKDKATEIPWKNKGEMLTAIRATRKEIGDEKYLDIFSKHDLKPIDVAKLDSKTGFALYKDLRKAST